MKMVTVILGPDSAQRVLEALEGQGFPAITRVSATGRGISMGCMPGSPRDIEREKEMIVTLVEDERLSHVVSLITTFAQKGNCCRENGRIGDGKIIVTDVFQEITLRTPERNALLPEDPVSPDGAR